MRFRPLRTAAALLAFGAAWLSPPPSHAFSTAPINVADMIRQSDQIVSGTVTDVTQGIDPHGLPYTQIQLKVAESIRGNASGTMTFRQIGLQSPMAAGNGRKHLGLVAGMPRYGKGEQVVLFLTRTSGIGLRSTIGLEQGRFVLRGGNFENGVKNAGLFRNVDFTNISLDAKENSMIATQQGEVDAGTFVNLVRRAVAGNWWTTVAPVPVTPPRHSGPKKLKAGTSPLVVR